MATTTERKVTDGARALRAYLIEAKISLPKFCEQHGLNRIRVQRALNGERERFDVDFALSIQRATGGRVPMSLWSTDTLAPGGGGRPNPPGGASDDAPDAEPAPTEESGPGSPAARCSDPAA